MDMVKLWRTGDARAPFREVEGTVRYSEARKAARRIGTIICVLIMEGICSE